MANFFTVDWAGYIFNHMSLKIYEYEQEKHRKTNQAEKRKIIKNNRIIVKVNDDIIYDSKKEKDMSDDLYYALLSYGLKDSINSKPRNKKAPISYNIYPSITTIPMLNDEYSKTAEVI